MVSGTLPAEWLAYKGGLMNDKPEHIIYDSWLSQILNQDVYKLIVDNECIKNVGNDTLQEYRIVHKLKSRRVFVYSKIPVDALLSIKFLEELNFHFVDTNIIFEKPILPTHNSVGCCTVRFATPDDENSVVELARKNFLYSRFHLDSNIPHDAANTVKAEWVRNYFQGKRGEQMVIAGVNGRIAGFLQLLYGEHGRLIIDLIAVDQRWRRKGIAGTMIAYAESNCGDFRHIQVGTQIANIPSIRLYEKIGFRMTSAQYVFHYHNLDQKQ
jgi:ribosomal protein S18 acetylase RimI-like enzyme